MCLRRDCAVRAVSTALCNQPIHDLTIMRMSFKDNGKSGCGVVIKGIDLSVLWLVDAEMVSDSQGLDGSYDQQIVALPRNESQCHENANV